MTILNGDTIGFRPLEFQFLPEMPNFRHIQSAARRKKALKKENGRRTPNMRSSLEKLSCGPRAQYIFAAINPVRSFPPCGIPSKRYAVTHAPSHRYE